MPHTLLILDSVSLEIGDQRLLREASLSLAEGERVCLIGRNGAGKTTLLRIIADELQPDSGEIRRPEHLRISQLRQTLPDQQASSVYDYVATGLAEQQRLIAEYQRLSRAAADKGGLGKLQDLEQRIELGGGWQMDTRVQTILTELELPADRTLGELSGGWQRRCTLARALVNNPQLLLLDEPTNHLDLSTINWLENTILGFTGSVLFITHDRALLQRLATRIVELDRGRLGSWPGDYRKYLRLKENALAQEARNNALFDRKLEQEEAWIRQGIKARRTRNEGRVRALQEMRTLQAVRLKPQDSPRIHLEDAEQSGRKVIDAHNINHGYGDQQLIRGFSLKIRRGDRIGLIGNNGVGKTTLLRILLGELTADSGTVKHGTGLVTGVFDQQRERLDPDKTVAEIVGDGSDYVRLNGRDRHVIGYLKGFLFTPQRAMTRVKVLSGGECNRILLARLFTRATNLLVLDEPTNDLDVETLEVLEERLGEYQGTLIVVSHDRDFLDNVVTSTLVFEEDGRIRHYAGGYSDWLRQGHHLTETDNPNRLAARTDRQNRRPDRQPTKLSYLLQRELDGLPARIGELETTIKSLHSQMQESGFYSRPHALTQPVLRDLAARERDLELALARWEELEGMQTDLLGRGE